MKKKQTKKEKDFKIFQKMCQHTTKVRKSMQKNSDNNKIPPSLETETSGTYISQYFPQGLLYACLVEAYSFLKGPTDMLTLYEGKYKTELQKFAAMQLGRRRRDDYTDGTIRIPIESPPQ